MLLYSLIFLSIFTTLQNSMDIKHLIPDPQEDIVLQLLAVMRGMTKTFENEIAWGILVTTLFTQVTEDNNSPQIGYWSEAALLSLEDSLEKAREKYPTHRLLGTHFDDVTFVVREQIERMFTGQGFYKGYLHSAEEVAALGSNGRNFTKVLAMKIGVGVDKRAEIPIIQPYFIVLPLTLAKDGVGYIDGEPLYIYTCAD